MNDVIMSTAHELAQAIRKRQVSAVQVVQAHLEHIARHNPTLNAIVTLNEAAALQRAQQADAALDRGENWGPLHGVPVTIKDSLETAGLRTTSSYKPLADYVPQQDATVVARMYAAGAIVLGKTNLPELAMDIQTNSPLFGQANNPWDTSRTTGGSTGGGAAAVAAGLSPLEIGSDVGGSLRIPAHFCGVFGLKPTEHRVSGAGHIPGLPGDLKSVRHMACYGCIARCLPDLKLCLSIIAGPDGRDWDMPPVPLDTPQEKPLSDLRFAWTDELGNVPVTAETRAALHKLAGALAERGCRVERHNPPGVEPELAWQAYGEIFGSEMGAAMPAIVRLMGRLSVPRLYRNEPEVRALMRGFGLNMHRYVAALARRDDLLAAMERFLSDWDAWLCPVSPTPAFTHRPSGLGKPVQPLDVDGQLLPYWIGNMAYTSILNLTGNPVVVLPVARSQEGLPIGVQVVGRRWHDMTLLHVAEQLAAVTGPFQRPPGY